MSSILGYIFGSPKPKPAAPAFPAPPSAETMDTLGALRHQETQLEKRANFLEAQIKALLAQAQEELQKNNKPKALLLLKKKHLLDEQLRSTQGMFEKITQQRLSLELAQVQIQTIRAIEKTNTMLKASGVDIDKAQDVMDELGEHVEQSNEICRLFTQPIPGTESIHEAAEKELEDMLAVPSAAPAPAQPVAPAVDPVEQELLRLSEGAAAPVAAPVAAPAAPASAPARVAVPA
jgi:predicted DNA-binding ArsR family transcriptional regulator